MARGSQIKIKDLKRKLTAPFPSLEYIDFSKKFMSYDFNLEEWKGAVLCLFVEDSYFFIKRSDAVPSHKGQLALVGGHRKPGEGSPFAVVEREFAEETGLSANQLEYWGVLPPVFTAHDVLIVPVVAHFLGGLELFKKELKSNGEWNESLCVPFNVLANEDTWNHGRRYGANSQGHLLFRAMQEREVHLFEDCHPIAKDKNSRSYLLWGATARIIWMLNRIYFSSPG